MKVKTDQGIFIETITLLSDLVVHNTYNFEKFLKKLIKLITTIVPADSCLIYLYDKSTKNLTLVGSKKSHTNLLGKLSLHKTEGITGWVFSNNKPVILPEKAYEDDRFKGFKELPEDRYEAFLSLPVVGKEGVVGVVNIQNKKPYTFTKEEIAVLGAIVKIVASAFVTNALDKKVMQLESKLEERKIVERAKGILMKEKNISEKEAYGTMQKEAMKKRKSMKEIADAVVLLYG